MSAQYQASTRNGNLCKTLLSNLFLNTAVLGLSMVLCHPKNLNSLCRHFCSCRGSKQGDSTLLFPLLESFSSRSPISVSIFIYVVLRENAVASDTRLIQAPPNNKVITTKGSRNAVNPILTWTLTLTVLEKKAEVDRSVDTKYTIMARSDSPWTYYMSQPYLPIVHWRSNPNRSIGR